MYIPVNTLCLLIIIVCTHTENIYCAKMSMFTVCPKPYAFYRGINGNYLVFNMSISFSLSLCSIISIYIHFVTIVVANNKPTYTCRSLRLEKGGGQQTFISCECFLIAQPFLNIYRHAIHQIEAEYHSYPLHNSSEVKMKIVKEIKK